MRQFAHFLIAGGVAAAANFLSRIALSMAMPYPAAISVAYVIGMITAFTLNRHYVFPEGNEHLHKQAFWFTLVNILALAQTLAVSLLLANWLLPALGVAAWREEIAHAVGVAVPIFSSYVGHRRLSFRVR
jgi:putative flippase GtrA